MKGRKTGGVVMNDAASKPARRNSAPKIMDAAEAMKRGGKAIGKMKGDKAKAHMGRAPRKSGGRTGSNMSPLSSAAKGTPPKGHKVDGSL
jgi:hypothetical protein